tara:strand:+ start:266 stop:499 length:234 start_codon:yes stop_codon:yes gene_type:complete
MKDPQKHVVDVEGTEYLVVTHWYDDEPDVGVRSGYAVQDVYSVSGIDNMGVTIDKHVCSYQHADLYIQIEEQINNEL